MARVRDETSELLDSRDAKTLGAYYTDAQIADFLVWWAIRSARNTVMDPCFGGGVFLRSACDRLTELGGQPTNQVFGVEIDPDVYTQIADKLSDEFGVRKPNLLLYDFFDIDPTVVYQVDTIVGNPPFIRYQRFSGDARKRALMRAAEQGVHLTELASSWAPFLVHSIAMLRQGGRLAMVIPAEIGHAAYALPVLDYLPKSFGKVTFLTFQKKLFPNLSQDTLLLLAENKGATCSRFLWRDLAHTGILRDMCSQGRLPLRGTKSINAQNLAQGHERLIEQFVPRKTRDLYYRLEKLSLARRLGELANVGIGYVTGANSFFHLSAEEANHWEIPTGFLRPAIRRGRALSGLRLTHEDWRNALAIGEASYLLYIETEVGLPTSIRHYLEFGEQQGASQSYKCRTRSPWFCVPHVYRPDALLSYMSGTTPRLVANDAGVVASNSLHILRLYPHTTLTNDTLAVLWQTSLTQLSVEVEGHGMGGGMLKLEPTEAENVIVAWPQHTNGKLKAMLEELDTLVRSGDIAHAQARADAMILREGIGLSKNDCRLLQEAADTLRDRRYSRSTKT